MRYRALVLALIFPGIAAVPAVAQPAPNAPSGGFAETVSKALPSVVTLSAVQHFLGRSPRFQGGEAYDPGQSGGAVPLGSGFAVDGNGRIATILSIVAEAEDIRATMADGRTVEAVVIGRDTANNLAIVQLGEGAKPPPLPLADPKSVQMGDWAVAVGRPAPQSPRIAAGVLSAPPGDLLWFDASVRGLTGGPLLDTKGTALGVATVLRTSQGDEMTVAIPASAIQDALGKIGKLQASANPVKLGVQVQPVSDQLADALGLDDDGGALVAYVDPASPAAKAGVKPGDVILSFGGAEVDEARDLPGMIAMSDTSKPVEMELWRDRQKVKVTATLASTQQAAATTTPAPAAGAQAQGKATEQQPTIGVVLAPLTPELKSQIGLDSDTSGVVIVGVRPGSPAAQGGLRPGDVIVEVAGTPVSDPAKVVDLVRQPRKAGSGGLILRINRRGSFGYTVLPS